MSITTDQDWQEIERQAKATSFNPPSPREMMRLSAAAYRDSAAMWLDTAKLCADPGIRAQALVNAANAQMLAQGYEQALGAERN